MNLFKEVNVPFNFWTSLFGVGEFIHVWAYTYQSLPRFLALSNKILGTFRPLPRKHISWVESPIILSDLPKHSLHVLSVKLFPTRFYDHAIQIHFQCLSYFLLEDHVHPFMVGHTNILYSEGHDVVLIIGMFDHELCLYPVEFEHMYLIIPRISIHEWKQLISNWIV